ncbi:D-amino acid oxidase Aao [Mycobacterium lentiflavum]|uniref:D-amino acid oxidase Aao n=2 Tax=Mycobacterium simiae complex TaxID=2249310 RepID=A0A0E4CRK5_MYCLN|nr:MULTISPECIES: FAD-dependent oxidoreductase [Mycobacterium simiae complex]ORJ54375.1 amino acid oxidase [Mycobacterium simiae]ULP45489.1 FAD-binding oxidoreductase [Mycobacterium lentiflavum]CQD24848.1 D-amino acid oxidase Aao [Mycobacterium lentiflavum]
MRARTHQPSALVIGAGISGGTTALVLARRGWRVVVAANRFDADTVSSVAGAVWEWPPSVCGRHHNQAVHARAAVWALDSYLRFSGLAADHRTGVIVRPTVFYFSRPIEQDRAAMTKMAVVKQLLPRFVHDVGLIAEYGVNAGCGVVDAYSYPAPTIDTAKYLRWLAGQAQAAGVTVVRRSICGPLAEQHDKLLAEFGTDLIVNCSGLGARELACDPTVQPHRAALLRVVNDGTSMPRVTAVHAVAGDPSTDNHDAVFIAPRGADRLLLGALVEPGKFDTDLTLDNYPPLREMLDRCTEFLPTLRVAQLDSFDPLWVGLQPFREGGVRLQIEPDACIVHNYGHGDAGVTLSWGCAREVADLAAVLLAHQRRLKTRRHSNSEAASPLGLFMNKSQVFQQDSAPASPQEGQKQ